MMAHRHHDDDNTPLAAQTARRNDPTESAHLDEVCDSYRQYATFARAARLGQSQRVLNLPPSQRELLPPGLVPGSREATEREQILRDAELRNQFFLDLVLRHAGVPSSQDVIRESTAVSLSWSTDENISKVSSVLKSLARDWSEEGRAEREMCYMPILDGIKRFLPVTCRRSPPRIVVPGAGVGRLAMELSSIGYEVQGNEFSLHMLLASDFILNGGVGTPERPLAISPWLSETKNVCNWSDRARKIFIPDVSPVAMLTQQNPNSTTAISGVPPQPQSSFPPRASTVLPEFSMSAGEFVSVYSSPSEQGQWQGVACCFFIDTAPCVVEYLRVMHQMLEKGGILVNLGPLLFHWSGPPARPDENSWEEYNTKHSHLDRRYLESIDLSWCDVRKILLNVGFKIEEERVGVSARYTTDPRSFVNTDYRCVFFVARKTN